VKKLSLELGASCPVAILPDADIELAAQAVALGGYANAGQVCISVQRVLADRSIVGDFLDALVPKVEAIRAGDPNSADIGTLISEREACRVETALRESTGHNGGAPAHRGERDGAVVTPAVVADVSPDAPLSQDELFGPAVAVTSVSGIDAAVQACQQHELRPGRRRVYRQRRERGALRARGVDAGNVHINWTPLWRADLMPYGGLKGSGVGKEGPRAAVQEMTEVKTIVHARRRVTTP